MEWNRITESTRIVRAWAMVQEMYEKRAACIGHAGFGSFGGIVCERNSGRRLCQCSSLDDGDDEWTKFLDTVCSARGECGEYKIDLAALWAGVSGEAANNLGLGFREALFLGDKGVARAVARYLCSYERARGDGPSTEVYDTLLELGDGHIGLVSLCSDPGPALDDEAAKTVLVAGLGVVCELVERYGDDEHVMSALATFTRQEAKLGRVRSVEDIARRYKRVERCVHTLSTAS
jgi:hypothetical protein